MKKTLFVLIMTGCLSASTFLGSFYLSKNYEVRMYGKTEPLFHTKDGWTTQALGIYNGRADHSGGDMTIDMRVSKKQLVKTIRHEICHAWQDQQRKPMNETECEQKQEMMMWNLPT